MCIGNGGKPDADLTIKSGYGNPNVGSSAHSANGNTLFIRGRQDPMAAARAAASPESLLLAAKNYGQELGQPKTIDLHDETLAAARKSQLLRQRAGGRASSFLTGAAGDTSDVPLGKTILGGG